MKHFFPFLLLLLSQSLIAQELRVKIVDNQTQEPLIGASCVKIGTSMGGTADLDGIVRLTLSQGKHSLRFSFLGYEEREIEVLLPEDAAELMLVTLSEKEEVLNEIIVEGTRSNRSIAAIPTRTEVLTEEIGEAASMEPSRIAHLLTHSTGIQVQTTSASSNGAVVRIQGLNGRYTQLLKDGFILYGGFSGSLDIMQIPPLDLRQVEFIKGPNSTLYGAGAISGIINLLSKKADKDENLIHLNVSSIGSYDFNAFNSKRLGKWGFTNLANIHVHTPYDADGDDYSDVPGIRKITLNPKVFFNPNEATELYFGLNLGQESRRAGDMQLIDGRAATMENFYYDFQESSRITSQFRFTRTLNEAWSINLKNSLNKFDRSMEIRINPLGELMNFGGTQRNAYSEFVASMNQKKQSLSLGINHILDDFAEKQLDSSSLKRKQNQQTLGFFGNYLWDVHTRFILEAGLRYDLVSATSDLAGSAIQKNYLLPKLSLLYKINEQFSLRSSASFGYRMPSLFSEEAEPIAYSGIQSLDYKQVAVEESRGANIDFKYLSDFGTRNWLLSFNQIFFYNIIDNPIFLIRPSIPGDALNPIVSAVPQLPMQNSQFMYQNIGEQVESRGFESQLKLSYKRFTWFLGYTYTDVYLVLANSNQRLTQVPFHNIKGDILYSQTGKWRIGIDYEYDSPQRLSDGSRSPALFSSGIIVERSFSNLTVFLNAENYTDTRQTRFESLRSGPYDTPQLTQVYAPLEGFYTNLGIKLLY